MSRHDQLVAEVTLNDVERPEAIRLALALFDVLDGYCPDPHEDPVMYDLPGGAGLVDLADVLDDIDLATLRECLIGRHEARLLAGGAS